MLRRAVSGRYLGRGTWNNVNYDAANTLKYISNSVLSRQIHDEKSKSVSGESINASLTNDTLGTQQTTSDVKFEAIEYGKEETASEAALKTTSEATLDAESDGSIPWYLREETTSPIQKRAEVELPEIPENAPEELQVMLEYLAKDLGLNDIELYDVYDDHSYNSYNYMIVSTGKSDKHIYKAATELKNWMKHMYGIVPRLEGFVSNAMHNKHRRRMIRRARKGPMATDKDYKTPANSWIMCNTEIEGICINILTTERREELDLEALFLGKEAAEAEAEEDDRPWLRNSHSLSEQNARNYNYFFGSGSKRHMHASARKFDHSPGMLYRRFLSEPLSEVMNNSLVYLEDSKKLTVNSLEDFQFKYSLLKSIHIVNPDLVSFQEVEDALLDKYRLPKFMLQTQNNLGVIKSKDFVEYLKLVIDSPELISKDWTKELKFTGLETKVHIADYYLDKVSKFISKLYRFSDEEVSFQNEEVVPLLLRMTMFEEHNEGEDDGVFIGSRHIDDVFAEGSFPEQLPKQKHVSLSYDRLRGLLDVFDHYKCLPNHEIVLHIYGTGTGEELNEFWKYWNIRFNVLGRSDSQVWQRLVVYLGLRCDPSLLNKFFTEMWGPAASAGWSFTEVVDPISLSPAEKTILKGALQSMISSVGDEQKFGAVETYIEKLSCT